MMSVFGIQKEFFRVNMSKTSVSVNKVLVLKIVVNAPIPHKPLNPGIAKN